MLHRRCLVGGLAALCLAAVALAAAPPQEPVFRGGVTFVNVDAYPRHDGHLVEGLRAEDFQVLEDGKPQRVTAFEFIRIAPNPVDAVRQDPNTQQESERQAADPHNRLFVVYLDLYHTDFAGAHDTRGPLLGFLERTIGATDLFGVMTPEVPPSQLVFGRRIDTLESELGKWWSEAPSPGQGVVALTPIEFQLANCPSDPSRPNAGDALILLYREDLLMTNLEELMVRLRDLRDERKNLVLISGGWIPQPPDTAMATLASGSIPRIGSDPGTGRLGVGGRQGTLRDQTWCDQQILRLSSIDFQDRFRLFLTTASRANVSFYPVDVGGLRTNAPEASMRRTPSAMGLMNAGNSTLNTLRTLADNTDGRAIVNTNDLTAGFRQIGDDLSAYYLLGYSSTNTNADGKYRRITVKVNRPGVSVSARQGYLAPSVETRAAEAAKAAAAAVPATVADELARLSRLRTDTELLTYGVRSTGGLDVAVEISLQEMAHARWNAGADVRVVLDRPSGEPVAVTGRIEPGARAALVHLPVATGEVGPWPISVRVSQGNASLEDRAEIATAEPAAIVGAPMVFRGTSSARIPLRPVADFLFRRSERLRVEWPARQPLTERTARVLDRKGQPLALEATVTEGPSTSPAANDTTRVVAVDLALAPLAEGDYLIELTAGAGGQTERRLLAFRVVR